MTIQDDQFRAGGNSRPPGQATPVQSDTGNRAEAAKAEDAGIAQTAGEAGRDVAREISDQVASVAQTAKQQVDQFVSQARDELRAQGETRGGQIVENLRTVGRQMSALGDGRPEEAGGVATFMRDAQQRIESYVASLDRRGPGGLLEDVTSFARRRPGAFLFACAAAGFAAGRVVRSGGMSGSSFTSGNGSPSALSTPPSGTAYVGPGAPSNTFGSDPSLTSVPEDSSIPVGHGSTLGPS